VKERGRKGTRSQETKTRSSNLAEKTKRQETRSLAKIRKPVAEQSKKN